MKELTKLEKKKALVQWLNSFITIAYYLQLKKDKVELEDQLINISRTNFVNGEVKERDSREIECHNGLNAIDLNLKILIPLFEFKKWCEEQGIEMVDVAETYEVDEVGSDKKSEYNNPLDLFINEL